MEKICFNSDGDLEAFSFFIPATPFENEFKIHIGNTLRIADTYFVKLKKVIFHIKQTNFNYWKFFVPAK